MAFPLPPRWYDWRKGPGWTSPMVSQGMKMTNARCPAVSGMCGRFSLVSEMGELQGRFEFAAAGLPHAPRYNIAPSQPLLAVLNGGGETGGPPALGPDTLMGQERLSGESLDQRPRRDGCRAPKLSLRIGEAAVPGPRRRVL